MDNDRLEVMKWYGYFSLVLIVLLMIADWLFPKYDTLKECPAQKEITTFCAELLKRH